MKDGPAALCQPPLAQRAHAHALLAKHPWVQVWATQIWQQPELVKLADAAQRESAIAKMCGEAPVQPGAGDAQKGRDALAPSANPWAAFVLHLSRPATALDLLHETSLRQGGQDWPLERLLTVEPMPRMSTRLRPCTATGGGRAVEIDILGDWAAGSVVPSATGDGTVLHQSVLLALTLAVRAPLSAATTVPAIEVREAFLHVGQRAADALTPPPTSLPG